MITRRALTWVGAVACGVGILVPPSGFMSLLGLTDNPPGPGTITGFWIFKGALLFNGALLVALARWRGVHDTPLDSSPPLTRWQRVLVGLIVIVAVGLRLPGLGSGLWYDEIQTLVHYVRLPLGQILTTFDSTNQHILYSALARVSVSIAGESVWALRLPAALLGVSSLVALVEFGRRIGLVREALLTAGLLSVSYHHVWFSQNARGYTGLMLWALLGSMLLLDLLRDRGTPGRILAYGFVMALGVFSHLTALFILVGHGIVWLATWYWTTPRARTATGVAFVCAGACALLLYAPVVPQALGVLTQVSGEPVTATWQDPFWLIGEAFGGLARGVPGGSIGVLAGLCIAMAGVVRIGRLDRLALSVMLAPIGVTVLVLVASHHNLWPRLFFFATGFVGLLAVSGVFGVLRLTVGARAEVIGSVILGLVMALSVMTVPRAWGPKQAFEAAADSLAAVVGPEDAVAVVDLATLPFREWLHAPWPVVETPTDLQRLEAGHRATYVVTTFAIRLRAAHPALVAYLGSAYDTLGVFPGSVGDGAVVVFTRRGGLPSLPRGARD